jgi:hypothetical protein
MKTCPVCKAVAFDDALVCFGCMHRYDSQETDGSPQESAGHREAATGASRDEEFEFPPAFYIKLVPTRRDPDGVSWRCSVGIADS